MTTEKQINANRENGKKGGVKTPEGKAISRFNALKHGILSEIMTEYDNEGFQKLNENLKLEYRPQTIMEEILIERITVLYVRLFRVAKAEKEYILSVLNPQLTKTTIDDLIEATKPIIIKDGYVPKIDNSVVENIERIFHRYETSLENRLYKAIHELERFQRMRQGEKLPAPIPIDINIVNDKEED